MPSKNINQLTALDVVASNLSNTLFVVYDSETGTTKKATLSQIDTAIERSIQNVSSAAVYANAAYQTANSAGSYANSAFAKANTLFNATADANVATITAYSVVTGLITNEPEGAAFLDLDPEGVRLVNDAGDVKIISQYVGDINQFVFTANGNLELPAAINFQQNAGVPLGGPVANGVNDRITLWDFEGTGSGYNYAIGVEGNHIWFSMDVNNGTGGYKFYSRNNQIFKIRDDGALLFSDNTVQNTAFNTANVNATNITANNVTVTGNLSVDGVVLQWHTPVPLTSKGDPGVR